MQAKSDLSEGNFFANRFSSFLNIGIHTYVQWLLIHKTIRVKSMLTVPV